jgi:hypothetical protein
MGASVLSAKVSRKSPGVTVGALGHTDPYSTAAVTPRPGHENDAATEASYTASIAHGMCADPARKCAQRYYRHLFLGKGCEPAHHIHELLMDPQDQSRDRTASRHLSPAALRYFARAQTGVSYRGGSARQMVRRRRRSLGTHASRVRYRECRTQRGCQQDSHTPRQGSLVIVCVL